MVVAGFNFSDHATIMQLDKALGVDLLNNSNLVEQQQDLVVKTAVWFYNANNMAGPAKQGDFAATT